MTPASSFRPQRGTPDVPLLEWVAERSGSPVADSRRLVGGISSLIVCCDLADGRQVVARQIEDRQWLEREPLLIAQEATALRLLEHSPLVTPRLIASDVDAGRLVMSFLPGSMRTTAVELAPHVEAMAAAAAAVAAVPLPDHHGLAQFWPWVPDEPEPPVWGDHGLWSGAIEYYHGRLAELGIDRPSNNGEGWGLNGEQPVLLHRDLHPLNMLWPDTSAHVATPAVVDWLNACVGHPHAELGHCRWNLTVLAGLEAADGFLGHYLRLTAANGPTTYDPLWDVVAMLDVGSSDTHSDDDSENASVLDGLGWHAVGRHDLTGPVIAAASDSLLRAALG